MKSCSRCGAELSVLSSVAADPHDEPAYYCSCWPTDWVEVLGILAVLGVFAGLIALAAVLS